MHTDTTIQEVKSLENWRIGIQGYPKTGKTWSALTFPNPIVLNLDNNIPKNHPKVLSGEVKQVPLYDKDFVKEKLSVLPKHPEQPFPLHTAVEKWLRTVGMKLDPDQTLVIDSMTRIGDRFDLHWDLNPALSVKTAKVDSFEAWHKKLVYFTELHAMIEALRCNVITIIHEQETYDDDGKINGLKPALTGSFGVRLAGHYPEWFRQSVVSKKDDKGNVIKDPETGKPYPRYIWEIQTDKVTKCGGNLVSKIKESFIDANYDSLVAAMK